LDRPPVTDTPAQPRLILASASPRRQAILREAGFDFEVHPADINEDQYPPNLLPADVAQHLAVAKADVVAARFPDDVTLAADTVVAFGDRLLGKPADADAARAMLTLLSETTHVVITGVCVSRPATQFKRSTRAMSAVRMRRLSPAEIEKYVASGDWQGKAGGYGIQDADPFVTRMSGSHTNIVGLPVHIAKDLLGAAGVYPNKGNPSSTHTA
jgi:septum formation protein